MTKYEKAYVYVFKGENRIKLGMAGDPEKRMHQIQQHSVDNLILAFKTEAIEDYLLVERLAHSILRRHKVKGEWYRVTVEEGVAAINSAIEKIKLGRAEEALTGVKYKYPKVSISITGKANVERLHKIRANLETELGRRISIREAVVISLDRTFDKELDFVKLTAK